MSDQFEVSIIMNNPMRMGKYHISRYAEKKTLCGIGVGHHFTGPWSIERAFTFPRRMVDKYPKRGFCKHCQRAAEKLRPILDRLAEL